MKKFNLFILSLIIVFSFSIVIKADCMDEELNEWATTIEPKFVMNSEKTAQEYMYAYFLTINPIRDDIIIKVTDDNGQTVEGENFELLDLYGVGCYTNIKEETYTIKVYGGQNSSCKNELLRTMTYTAKPYNDMIKTSQCEKYPEHELCQVFTDKTQNMTRDEFNSAMKEYEKEVESKNFTFKKLLNLLKEYIVYILMPFGIITIIYIVKIDKFKKKEKEL